MSEREEMTDEEFEDAIHAACVAALRKTERSYTGVPTERYAAMARIVAAARAVYQSLAVVYTGTAWTKVFIHGRDTVSREAIEDLHVALEAYDATHAARAAGAHDGRG